MKFKFGFTTTFLNTYDLIHHISSNPSLWNKQTYTLDCAELQIQLWIGTRITQIGYFVNGKLYSPFTIADQILISATISYFLPSPLHKAIAIKGSTNGQITPIDAIPQPIIGATPGEQAVIVKLTKASDLYKTLCKEKQSIESTTGSLSSILSQQVVSHNLLMAAQLSTKTDSLKPIDAIITTPTKTDEAPKVLKIKIKEKGVDKKKESATKESNFKTDVIRRQKKANKLHFHNSILLWDLENISLENLDTVRSLIPSRPTKEFIVTSQPLSKKAIAIIKNNELNVVNYHIEDSDGVIRDYINAHKTFFDEFIIISSDADFVPAVKELLDSGKKVHCIVREAQKNGVFSRLEGYSPNIRLSAI